MRDKVKRTEAVVADPDAAIEIKNLTYVYNPRTPFEKKALDGVSLTVRRGDFFGVIGQTGSGKSTLISHMNALTRVQKKRGMNADATVRVCGIDLTVKKPDLGLLRGKVGMVFQYPEYQLFADTVADDVAFGPKNLGLSAEETDERVRAAIRLVGLDYSEIADRSPFELSGGQKRRAAIAGVLAMRPELLILDEPTAGLDPEGKRELLALFRDVQRTTCPTIVMVSHNMDEVAECCNKVAVLGEGHILGVFAPEQLFSERELIRSLGLELPAAVELSYYLSEHGVSVRPDCLTERELIDALAAVYGGDGK